MTIQASELAAVVLQQITKEIPDALSKSTPFFQHLTKGPGKKYSPGGLYIQFPIKLINNLSSGYISGTNAVVDTTPSIQMQYGILNWKYYNFNVNFTLEDYTIARDEHEAVDFFASKIDGAIADSARELAVSSHGSSVTNPLAIEGLQDIVAASGTAYAGLLDTDYSDATAYLPVTTTDNTVNYANINKMITQLRARMQQAKLNTKDVMGLMNAGTYSRFMNAVQNQQYFMNESDVAKSGFKGINVNGVDFYLDADVPGTQDGATADNYLYIFPTDIMKLYYTYGLDKKSPFDGEVRLPNQPIMSIQHYMAMNLICNNRRLVAVNKNFIA